MVNVMQIPTNQVQVQPTNEKKEAKTPSTSPGEGLLLSMMGRVFFHVEFQFDRAANGFFLVLVRLAHLIKLDLNIADVSAVPLSKEDIF